MDSIGSRLKLARRKRKLTQQALADAAGVRQSTIGNIEGGSRTGLQSLQPIARALSINYEWLRDGHGPMDAAPDSLIFSSELLQRIQCLSANELRRLENQLRAAVDMNPLPTLPTGASSGEFPPATGTAGH